jgi:hypothetical protein
MASQDLAARNNCHSAAMLRCSTCFDGQWGMRA